MLGIKLASSGWPVTKMEAVRIELKQAVRQHNKLFMRLAAFLYFEHLLIDDLAQPYFNGVILNRKKVLHKLF